VQPNERPMTAYERWDFYWQGGDVECPSQEELDTEIDKENEGSMSEQQPITEADSGVVTQDELDEIITRHIQGVYRRHEMRLGRYEI
jgi:hypothetical protein